MKLFLLFMNIRKGVRKSFRARVYYNMYGGRGNGLC